MRIRGGVGAQEREGRWVHERMGGCTRGRAGTQEQEGRQAHEREGGCTRWRGEGWCTQGRASAQERGQAHEREGGRTHSASSSNSPNTSGSTRVALAAMTAAGMAAAGILCGPPPSPFLLFILSVILFVIFTYKYVHNTF